MASPNGELGLTAGHHARRISLTGGRGPRIGIATRIRVLGRSIRNSDLALLLTAAVVGGLVGLGVVSLQGAVQELHSLLFGIPIADHLSSGTPIEPWRLIAVPALGGAAYGVISSLLRRWSPRDIVDAIEANALYGGRMSLTGSLRLSFLTVLSAGVGASVGLEAAYTQLGSGIASRIGRLLRLRRSDLRTFVGCGAAAAIAAAFNAPLAGAFYAFELILGAYTLGTLAPVGIAALAGALVERAAYGDVPIFIVQPGAVLGPAEYIVFAAMGLAAAGIGIAAMTGVTFVESWSRRLAVPLWLRPAVGGLAIGSLALIFPEILGSGHGGILATMSEGVGFFALVALLIAKLAASAISIGSGFRGGMFSSSLFIGSLFGSAVASFLASLVPAVSADRAVFILVGMGSVAAAVVGAPVTIILLMLEASTDYAATIAVTAAVIIASFAVRHWFGYSFATWRFHLRGVPLRGAHDVGWLKDLTVERLMRRDVPIVAPDMPLKELSQSWPAGGPKYAVLGDADGRFAGMLDMHDVNAAALGPKAETLRATDLARGAAHFLTPEQSIRIALDLFMAADSEVLAVVSASGNQQILGIMTEAFALRRYNRELEKRRREDIGEDELFSPAAAAPSTKETA